MPVKEIIASRLGVSNMNKSKVCRCLFGMPDHTEIRRELDEQLQNMTKEWKTTWNFDPILDKPLNGRYEWSEDNDAPEFYRKGYRRTKFAKRRDLVESPEPKHSDSESEPDLEPASSVAVRLTTTNDHEDERSEAIDMKRENEKTPEAQIVRQTRITGKLTLAYEFHNVCT